MTTTGTDALTERIAQTLSPDAWEEHDEYEGHIYALAQQASRRAAAAVLPIVAEEVRKAKAEALREAASAVDLDKVAEEWSQGPGNRNDMHWAAGNAASSVVATLHDRAAEYETGDSDEHR